MTAPAPRWSARPRARILAALVALSASRAVLGVAAPPPEGPTCPHRAPSDEELRLREGESWPARLERLTRPWRGAPYARSPLGEGAGPDPDPRLRFDAFDCTTFVETALAAARVTARGAIRGELDRLRYAELPPRFETRRHLVISQWRPGLVELGVLEDVTLRVGGRETRRIRFRVGPKRWAQRRIARFLELPDARIPEGVFVVDYLPLELARTRDMPAGAVLDVVRVNWRLSPELVTHQGLVLRDPATGALVLRHASPVKKRVVDEPLEDLLERYRRAEKKWPIAGISLHRAIGRSTFDSPRDACSTPES